MSKKNQIAKLVTQETGMSLKEFCEKHLFTNYKAFQYRIRNNRCYPNEIMYLSWHLGASVEELFGVDYLELMQDQGPDELTSALKEMYKNADTQERKRLLTLIGHLIGNVTTADRIPPPEVQEEKPPLPKAAKEKPKPTKPEKTVAPKKSTIDDIFQGDDLYAGGNIRR